MVSASAQRARDAERPLTNVNGTSTPLLDLAPAELIRQWKFAQRLIPALIGLMRSLLLRHRCPLSAISPHALYTPTSITNANKPVIHHVKSFITSIIYRLEIITVKDTKLIVEDDSRSGFECNALIPYWNWEMELKAANNESALHTFKCSVYFYWWGLLIHPLRPHAVTLTAICMAHWGVLIKKVSSSSVGTRHWKERINRTV